MHFRSFKRFHLTSLYSGMPWARRKQSPMFSVMPSAPSVNISGGWRGSELSATTRSPCSCSRCGNPERAWQDGSRSRRGVRWRRRYLETKTPLLPVECLPGSGVEFLPWKTVSIVSITFALRAPSAQMWFLGTLFFQWESIQATQTELYFNRATVSFSLFFSVSVTDLGWCFILTPSLWSEKPEL